MAFANFTGGLDLPKSLEMFMNRFGSNDILKRPTVEPDQRCRKRIQRDHEALHNEPVEGIRVHPDNEDLTLAHAIIEGPKGTPYEGGFFYFLIRYPHNYPIQNPQVRLMTTGNGTVRFNPNLYADGKVCLSILGTWQGPGWTASYDTKAVLISIQSLMNEEPYYNEPGFEHSKGSASGKKASDQYNKNIRYQAIKVAAFDMYEKLNNDCKTLPKMLHDYIQSQFVKNLDFYHKTIADQIAQQVESARARINRGPNNHLGIPSYFEASYLFAGPAQHDWSLLSGRMAKLNPRPLPTTLDLAGPSTSNKRSSDDMLAASGGGSSSKRRANSNATATVNANVSKEIEVIELD